MYRERERERERERGYRLNVKNAIPCLNKILLIQNTVSHNYTAILQEVNIELFKR
jgi:hypothetical protein